MQARQAGVDIYSIGVGVAVDIAELTAISGQRDRVYYAEDFNSLQSIENEFVSATQVSLGPCPTEPSTPQERKSSLAVKCIPFAKTFTKVNISFSHSLENLTQYPLKMDIIL